MMELDESAELKIGTATTRKMPLSKATKKSWSSSSSPSSSSFLMDDMMQDAGPDDERDEDVVPVGVLKGDPTGEKRGDDEYYQDQRDGTDIDDDDSDDDFDEDTPNYKDVLEDVRSIISGSVMSGLTGNETTVSNNNPKHQKHKKQKKHLLTMPPLSPQSSVIQQQQNGVVLSPPQSPPRQLKSVLSLQSTSVALFDDALESDGSNSTDANDDDDAEADDADADDADADDAEADDAEADDDDDLSVVSTRSKSAVDESSKNVDKAEALAKEMQRILAEFQSTPSPSMDTTATATATAVQQQQKSVADNKAQLAPALDNNGIIKNDEEGQEVSTPANDTAFYYSKEKVLALAAAAAAAAVKDGTSISSSASSSSSDVSGTSTPTAATAVPLRPRRRPTPFGRRSSSSSELKKTATATTSAISPSSATKKKASKASVLLESIVLPISFLVLAVGGVICRHSFGGAHQQDSTATPTSSTSTTSVSSSLVWTILSIVIIVAPVLVLEYIVMGSFLSGTALQDSIDKMPELKRFLIEVRRKRLRAGWWYASEVRTLRRDIDETNKEIIEEQQHQQQQQKDAADQDDDSDARSLQHQMSREQHNNTRRKLEDLFDGERAGWIVVKEQLAAALISEKEINGKIQKEFMEEKEKQNLLQKKEHEQHELDMDAERSQWNTARKSLEQALSTAAAALEDETKTSELYAQMEQSRDVERNQWETERAKLKSVIQKANEEEKEAKAQHAVFKEESTKAKNDAKKMQDEFVNATKAQEEYKSSIEEMTAEHDVERAGFEAVLETANEEATKTKEEYECQIQELQTEVTNLQEAFDSLKNKYKTELTETQREREMLKEELIKTLALLEMERTEWGETYDNLEDAFKIAREETVVVQSELKHTQRRIENTKKVFQGERASWYDAQNSYEQALALLKSDGDKTSTMVRDRFEQAKKAIKSVEKESNRIKTILEKELDRKQGKIDSLEKSISQFENIISIQTTVEDIKEHADRVTYTKASVDDDDEEADEAASIASSTFGAVPFLGDVTEEYQPRQQQQQLPSSSFHQRIETSRSIDSSRSIGRGIDFSASNLTAGTNISDSSSYYSWVQKVQETHNTEKRELLCGMLTQHLQCQNSNRHVGQLLGSSRAALEAIDQDSNSVFGDCLMQYTAVSVSAKRYMDVLVSRTGRDDMLEMQDHVSRSLICSNNDLEYISSCGSGTTTDMEDSIRSNRSVALAANPWLRNAPLWEQLWSSFLMAKTNPFQLCQTAIMRLCSGIIPGRGGGASNNVVNNSLATTGRPTVPSTIASSSWGLPSMFFRTAAAPGNTVEDTTNTTTEIENEENENENEN
jgi:hypothetical protein